MGHGPAGGLGRPVHMGRRLGQERVTILHLNRVEQPAWAPLPRLSAVGESQRCEGAAE